MIGKRYQFLNLTTKAARLGHLIENRRIRVRTGREGAQIALFAEEICIFSDCRKPNRRRAFEGLNDLP
jgi:hypothetical protein